MHVGQITLGILILLLSSFSCSPKPLGERIAKTSALYGKEYRYVYKEKWSAPVVSPESKEIATGSFWVYHENGNLAVMGKMRKGKRVGLWEWYMDTGQLLQSSKYRNGEMVRGKIGTPRF